MTGFTGVDSAYEPPSNPDVRVKASEFIVDECVNQIVLHLMELVCDIHNSLRKYIFPWPSCWTVAPVRSLWYILTFADCKLFKNIIMTTRVTVLPLHMVYIFRSAIVKQVKLHYHLLLLWYTCIMILMTTWWSFYPYTLLQNNFDLFVEIIIYKNKKIYG